MTDRVWPWGNHQRPVAAGALAGVSVTAQGVPLTDKLAALRNLGRKRDAEVMADFAAAAQRKGLDATQMSDAEYAAFKDDFLRAARGLPPHKARRA